MLRVYSESRQADINNGVISPQAGQSSIEKLPSALIGQIFSHLGLQELGRGCSVSKKMKTALKNERNQAVWDKALFKRSTFGAEKWVKYFGDVGEEPPLPKNIIEILSSPCPFFENKRVRDTHILVLIPAKVRGEALTLNKLRKLIEHPNKKGHVAKYGHCNSDVLNAHGGTGINQSYWVLMTKDVIPGSRGKTYDQQKELVELGGGIGYTLPGVLEAAVCILMEHVVSGNNLFGCQPRTYTRCSEIVLGQQPVVVGGFDSAGLDINKFPVFGHNFFCVSALRKF